VTSKKFTTRKFASAVIFMLNCSKVLWSSFFSFRINYQIITEKLLWIFLQLRLFIEYLGLPKVKRSSLDKQQFPIMQ
jgi:hypothetical protein